MQTTPETPIINGRMQYLFRPSSVAIVGASERNYYAENAFRRLQRLGYEGKVSLVNPTKAEVYGVPATPRLGDLDEPVELAFVAVPRDSVLPVIEEAAAIGAKAAVVVSTGFAEEDEKGKALQERLVEKAREAGIALCGPACLGVMSPVDRFEAFAGNLGTDAPPGGLALVSQSGANVHALIKSGAFRGIGFSRIVSSGIGAVLGVADYLDHLVDDRHTKAIAMVIEQLPSASDFRAAALRALAAGKPIGVIRVGASEAGRRAVVGHTGAITSPSEFYDELFRGSGIVTARTVDELLDAMAIFDRVPTNHWPRGPRLGVISVSGGMAGMFSDVAGGSGLRAEDFSATTAARLREVLPPGQRVTNPLDVSRQVERRHGDRWPQVAEALLEDPEIDAAVAIPGSGTLTARLRAFAAVQARTGKPVVLSAASRTTELFANDEAAAVAAGEGVAALGDLAATARALAAAAHFAAARERDRPAPERAAPLPPPGERLLTESAARALLGDFGVRGPREQVVRTTAAAVAAAGDIGFPVVVKALNPELPHRSEHGLIALGLADGDAVAAAAERLLAAQAGTADPALTVQEMVADGPELLVAAIAEPGFPPLIVLGTGGELVELADDRVARFAPLVADDVVEMLSELRVGRLLEGYRSRVASDRAALVDLVVGFSRFADAARDWLREGELNPVRVLPDGDGAIALDALISVQAGQGHR